MKIIIREFFAFNLCAKALLWFYWYWCCDLERVFSLWIIRISLFFRKLLVFVLIFVIFLGGLPYLVFFLGLLTFISLGIYRSRIPTAFSIFSQILFIDSPLSSSLILPSWPLVSECFLQYHLPLTVRINDSFIKSVWLPLLTPLSIYLPSILSFSFPFSPSTSGS